MNDSRIRWVGLTAAIIALFGGSVDVAADNQQVESAKDFEVVSMGDLHVPIGVREEPEYPPLEYRDKQNDGGCSATPSGYGAWGHLLLFAGVLSSMTLWRRPWMT